MKRKSGRRERGGGRSPRHASPGSTHSRYAARWCGRIIEHRATLQLVSKSFGIAEMTIRNWLAAFQLGGEEGLVPKSAGRPSQGRDPSDPVAAAVAGLEAGESGVWRPADPRSGAAIRRRAGCVGEHGAAHPRGCGDGNAACARPHRPRRATPTTLRAGRAESNVWQIGHLHVSAQTPRAALP